MTDLANPIFTDADKARVHLEGLRWPNGPVCPHCGADGALIARVETTGQITKNPKKGKHRPARKGLHYCSSCTEQFTVQVGTVLEKSHIPLNKWLAAFYLMCSSKKGYSAHQLHRTLSISYKSAWFMAHRIREAMRVGGLMSPMGGEGKTIEVDETIYGRADTHPKGRKPKSKGRFRGITNSAHKNAFDHLTYVKTGVRLKYQYDRSVHPADLTTFLGVFWLGVFTSCLTALRAVDVNQFTHEGIGCRGKRASAARRDERCQFSTKTRGWTKYVAVRKVLRSKPRSAPC